MTQAAALHVVSVLGLLGSGLIAGVFFAFSTFVIRALDRLPPAQGIAAMQSINIVVINPWFLGAFVGTAAVSIAAIVLAVFQWNEPRAIFPIAGGALYFVGTFLVTGSRNVPLNDALAKLAPDAEGAEREWRRYVARWTRWNHVRTVAALVAMFAFLTGVMH